MTQESGESTEPEDLPVIHIRPSKGWRSLDLGELWDYRELLYFLTWRDIKVRYKQTVLGAAWAVLQPLFTMVVFSIIFGRLAKIPTDGVPYPIWSFAGLVAWTFFANGMTQSSNSLVGSANLLKKVYFPRLAIPVSSILSGVVDFALAFVVLLGMMVCYGLGASPHIGAEDLKNGPRLALRLRDGRAPVTVFARDLGDPLRLARLQAETGEPALVFLRGRLTEKTQRLLSDYGGQDPLPAALEAALAAELDQLVRGECLYDEEGFAGVELRDSVRRLLAEASTGKNRVQLNRMLLEDALGGDLRQSYVITLSARLLWVPGFLALALVAALGIGLWLSGLNVQFRDVRYAIPFLTQAWLFVSPVAYPASLLPEAWRPVYGLNPMAGVIEGFRWALLGTETNPWAMIGASTAVALAVLVGGAFYFRRLERSFSDVV